MPETKPRTLAGQVAEASAQLDALQAELRLVPLHFRQSTDFRAKVGRKHKLMARLEALRRLQSLEK
jgi:hypothetical protein